MYIYELRAWGGHNQINAHKGLPNITRTTSHVVYGNFANIVVNFWG